MLNYSRFMVILSAAYNPSENISKYNLRYQHVTLIFNQAHCISNGYAIELGC